MWLNVFPGTLRHAFLFFILLVPIVSSAQFYYLAHSSMHFFLEARRLVPLLSDLMGDGNGTCLAPPERPTAPYSRRKRSGQALTCDGRSSS